MQIPKMLLQHKQRSHCCREACSWLFGSSSCAWCFLYCKKSPLGQSKNSAVFHYLQLAAHAPGSGSGCCFSAVQSRSLSPPTAPCSLPAAVLQCTAQPNPLPTTTTTSELAVLSALSLSTNSWLHADLRCRCHTQHQGCRATMPCTQPAGLHTHHPAHYIQLQAAPTEHKPHRSPLALCTKSPSPSQLLSFSPSFPRSTRAHRQPKILHPHKHPQVPWGGATEVEVQPEKTTGPW